ncbi:auxilin-like protein, partial [Trifolium medium]|nr:auxilin-like protein [Trifolium medium]
DMEVDFVMTKRQKIVFGCLKAANAQDFLLAITIDRLGQPISPVEYCTILRCCLMILLIPKDDVCPACLKACLDTFVEHANSL